MKDVITLQIFNTVKFVMIIIKVQHYYQSVTNADGNLKVLLNCVEDVQQCKFL
jgi:hypothetical protein